MTSPESDSNARKCNICETEDAVYHDPTTDLDMCNGCALEAALDWMVESDQYQVITE